MSKNICQKIISFSEKPSSPSIPVQKVNSNRELKKTGSGIQFTKDSLEHGSKSSLHRRAGTPIPSPNIPTPDLSKSGKANELYHKTLKTLKSRG